MTCGIYLLNFENTPKVYVGQSVNIERRFRIHCMRLLRGTHTPKLNQAYLAYGLPSLEIVEICEPGELNEMEQFHISTWDSVLDGFNTSSDPLYIRLPKYAPLPNSKYSKDQLLDVLDLLIDSEVLTFKKIHILTGVSIATIKNISAGLTHKWLYNIYPEKYNLLIRLKGTREIGYNSPNATLSKHQIIAIFKDILSNTTKFKDIASKYNTNSSIVGFIAQGKSHTWLKSEFPEEYSAMLQLRGTRSGGTLLTQGKPIPKVLSPAGELFSITNIRQFGREHNIPYSSLHGLISGKTSIVHGWSLVK